MGRVEGVSAAPEGGAALAALDRLIADQRIGRDEVVVLFNTGGALKYLGSRFAGRRASRRTRRRWRGPSGRRRNPWGPFASSPRFDSSGTEPMSGGWNATMRSVSPRFSSSTALPPKPRREHAVERRRRSAALQVTEHDGACLLAGHLFERRPQSGARRRPRAPHVPGWLP